MRRILFTEATLKELNFPDTQRELKAVCVITAPLEAETARLLKCGHLFKGNGDPIDAVGPYTPDIKLSDIELQLPSGTNDGLDNYRPELIRGFQIKPKDDLHLQVTFRAHITGVERAATLLDSRTKYLGKKFECVIRSLQEEFNFSEDTEGTPVNMSGTGEKESNGPLFTPKPCELCDLDIPRNEDGKHMKDGELRDCPRPVEREEKPGPVLASMREVNGGKSGPKRRSDGKGPQAPDPKEIEDSVSVQ